MKKYWMLGIVATAIISATVGRVFAVGDEVIYNPFPPGSNHTLDGIHGISTHGIEIVADLDNLEDVDVFDFGPGFDVLNFESRPAQAGAFIIFDGGLLSGDTDWIFFNPNNATLLDDDLLEIRADNLLLNAPNGDVIIRLGS